MAAHQESASCSAGGTSAGALNALGSRAARWAALDAASSAPAVQSPAQHLGAEDLDIITDTESEDSEGEAFGGIFAD